MEFCYRTANVWQLVGKVFFIFKIAIPLIIIVLAMYDLGKAVLSSDDKAIKNSTLRLVKRVITGVIIFFIPTFIRLAFLMITQFSDEAKKDFGNCIDCLTSPSECDLSNDNSIYK